MPPSNDVAAVIIHDGREVIPAPARDLEIGEIGLPQLDEPDVAAALVLFVRNIL